MSDRYMVDLSTLNTHSLNNSTRDKSDCGFYLQSSELLSLDMNCFMYYLIMKAPLFFQMYFINPNLWFPGFVLFFNFYFSLEIQLSMLALLAA